MKKLLTIILSVLTALADSQAEQSATHDVLNATGVDTF